MVSFLAILVSLGNFSLGILYPTFQTVQAIESRATADDTQWLTYWLTYSLLQILENILWPLGLKWLWPVYVVFRVALIAWLVLPQTKGSSYVYEDIVRPVIKKARSEIKKVPALENAMKKVEGKTIEAPTTSQPKPLGDALSHAVDQETKKTT